MRHRPALPVRTTTGTTPLAGMPRAFAPVARAERPPGAGAVGQPDEASCPEARRAPAHRPRVVAVGGLGTVRPAVTASIIRSRSCSRRSAAWARRRRSNTAARGAGQLGRHRPSASPGAVHPGIARRTPSSSFRGCGPRSRPLPSAHTRIAVLTSLVAHLGRAGRRARPRPARRHEEQHHVHLLRPALVPARRTQPLGGAPLAGRSFPCHCSSRVKPGLFGTVGRGHPGERPAASPCGQSGVAYG